MFGLRNSDLRMIKEVFQNHPGVSEAFIFGSRAMGNYKEGSDVDIALKGDMSPQTLIAISAELNEVIPLPYKFDVIAYSQILSQELLHHIDQHGISFYSQRSSSPT